LQEFHEPPYLAVEISRLSLIETSELDTPQQISYGNCRKSLLLVGHDAMLVPFQPVTLSLVDKKSIERHFPVGSSVAPHGFPQKFHSEPPPEIVNIVLIIYMRKGVCPLVSKG